MSERMPKINELILQQLGAVINREMELPDIFVTLTRVTTSADLNYATIYVSVLPDDKSDYALKRLNDYRKHLRAELAGHIEFRAVPRLEFRADKSGKEASDIEALLDKLKEETDQQSAS